MSTFKLRIMPVRFGEIPNNEKDFVIKCIYLHLFTLL